MEPAEKDNLDAGSASKLKFKKVQAFLQKHAWATIVILAIVTTAVSGFPGIKWGLPSRERNELIFDSRTPGVEISEKVVEDSWKYFPEFAWDKSAPGAKVSRPQNLSLSAFNAVRSYHPDEYVILKSISNMHPRRLDFSTGFYGWPCFFIYIVAGAIAFGAALGLIPLERSINFYFQHPHAIARMYIAGRLCVLVFGVMAVLFLMQAARKRWGWEGMLSSVAVLFLCPAWVVNLHYMTGDVPMVAFLSLWIALTSRFVFAGEKGDSPLSTKKTAVIGVAFGLAVGTKYQAALLAPMVPLAFLMAGMAAADWGQRVKQTFRLSAIAFVAAGVAFVVTNFGNLVDVSAWAAIVKREVTSIMFTRDVKSSRQIGSLIYCATANVFWLLGPVPLLLCCMGVARTIKERDRFGLWLAAMLAWGILCLVAIGTPFVRHYLLVIAPACLLAAHASAWMIRLAIGRAEGAKGFLAGRARSCLLSRVLALFILCSAVGQGFRSWEFCSLFASENVRDVAGHWIHDTIAPETSIATARPVWQYELPPIDPERYRIEVTGPDINRLRESGAKYFLFSSAQTLRADRMPRHFREETAFWAFVRSGKLYRPRKVFSKTLPWPWNTFARWMPAPEDMQYVNPTIFVYHRVSSLNGSK